MLLRASSATKGDEVDITAVTRGGQVQSGVTGGDELVAFAEAAMAGSEAEVRVARENVRLALGDEATVDVAAVIGNFERMVRIADGTGIPLDTPLALLTSDMASEIGTDQFASAANTPRLNALQRTLGRAMALVMPFVLKVYRPKSG